MTISDYGFHADMTSAAGTPARIIAVHKERFGIVSEYGEGYARLKTGEYYDGSREMPTVGDFVLVDYNPSGDSRILDTLPRKTFFSRADPDSSRGQQAIAANFDYVFILQSLNMDFNPRRLERYLAAAWQSGATPVILLTKADLVDDPLPWLWEAEASAPGVSIHIVSAYDGSGLDDLCVYLQPGKTAVFLGSSGVGKSSLVNALAGEEVMTTGGIREDDSKGRHTTTHRQLLMLRAGFMIIDTPGMRELGVWDVDAGLDTAFSDVEGFLGRCRFRDCRHEREPGCAIRAAIESGQLDAARWDSYQKLQNEAQSREELRQRKTAFMKGVAKANKNRKKEIW